VPTGVALRDAREQLFGAAERVLLRDGASALTSRAVTTEAGVAKGVLHRHFADFDAFLAELVLDRAARVEGQAGRLRESAGTGTVAGHVGAALMELFSPVAVEIVALLTFRDGLRARLRAAGAARIPVLTEATAMLAAYLAAERDLGRVAAEADVDTLALTLIGAGHLLFAGRDGTPPEAGAVDKVVATTLAGVLS
jgi:AcrR family transcriptional regulator